MAGKPAMPEASKEHGNLLQFIDQTMLECLNQSPTHPVQNAFDGASETWLQSDPDTDDQLLISVGFRMPVKISSVKIVVPDGAAEADEVPTKIKIFTGLDNSLDFGEAEDREATQELTVLPGQEMPVKFVKFQNVSFLKVFVPASTGGITSKIRAIQFIGIPEQALDMKEFKPIKG